MEVPVKKTILVAVLSCIVGLFLIASDTPTTASPDENGGGGSCSCTGGGTVHYNKRTFECTNAENRTEVRCIVGGNELCVPQNCP